MSSALDRTLFLLAQCRLLLLEIQDVERQLNRLAATATASERALLEEGVEVLEEIAEAGRSALAEIEELVPAIEAEQSDDTEGAGP